MLLHLSVINRLGVHRTKNAPTMTIVRHSEHERQGQQQEALPYIPEVSVKERLRVSECSFTVKLQH